MRTDQPRAGRALALVCVIYFMVILDSAIVRLAIPVIQRHLGLSAAGETWVANGYMLAFGSLLLLGGRLADLYGRRRLLLLGLLLFTLASLACGLARSGGELIAARVIQGLGAAAMTPAALSSLMCLFPDGPHRGRALGRWAASGGAGATAAWLIGGPLVDGLGWQWVFWINVPIGAGLAVLALRLLSETRGADVPRSFDLPGAASITAGLAVLTYAIVTAPVAGWASPQTALLAVTGIALLVAFAVIEVRSPAPLVPRRIARSRGLLIANIGLGGAMATVYGTVFVFALYGQVVLGWSALRLGLAGTVMPVAAAAGSVLGPRLVARHGAKAVSICAMAALGGAVWLLTGLPVRGGYLTRTVPALTVFGLGLGAAATAYSITTLAGVQPDDAGLAAGLNNTFESIFGVIGTALMASVALSRTGALLHHGASQAAANDGGVRFAFAVALVFPLLSIGASALLGRRGRTRFRAQSAEGGRESGRSRAFNRPPAAGPGS